jgi:hypothetical protein
MMIGQFQLPSPALSINTSDLQSKHPKPNMSPSRLLKAKDSTELLLVRNRIHTRPHRLNIECNLTTMSHTTNAFRNSNSQHLLTVFQTRPQIKEYIPPSPMPKAQCGEPPLSKPSSVRCVYPAQAPRLTYSSRAHSALDFPLIRCIMKIFSILCILYGIRKYCIV